jgi:hypothetical protein
MTLDQWIQVGMLALGSIPLLGYGTKRWVYDRYFGVRLDAKICSRNGAYVQEITLFPTLPPLVKRVAVWARVHVINRSASKMIVTKILAYEEGSESRSVIANPVRSVEFGFETDAPTDMIELPVTIEPGDIWSGWVLLGITIPSGFAILLYQLYATEAEKSQTVRMFRYDFDKFRRQVMSDAQKGLEPVLKLVDLTFSAVNVTDPILRRESDAIDNRPRMGRVPSHARGDMLPLLLKSGEPIPSETIPDRFVIEVRTADRRAISYRIKTGGDPFWFFRREYQNTA